MILLHFYRKELVRPSLFAFRKSPSYLDLRARMPIVKQQLHLQFPQQLYRYYPEDHASTRMVYAVFLKIFVNIVPSGKKALKLEYLRTLYSFYSL